MLAVEIRNNIFNCPAHNLWIQMSLSACSGAAQNIMAESMLSDFSNFKSFKGTKSKFMW